MGEEYSTASRGTLKLKGVHDGKVTKPKRKKKRPKGEGDRGLAADGEGETAVVRAEVEAEAKDPVDEGDRAAIETRDPEPGDSRDAAEFTPRGDEGPNGDAPASVGKTEAQLRHEARRRRMVRPGHAIW